MLAKDANSILERYYGKAASCGKHALAASFFAIIGVICGWFLHNTYWRSEDLSYTLMRATHFATFCTSKPHHELALAVEARVGKPSSQFTLDDYLVAIDYVFDTISRHGCAPNQP